jgi:WS/DGAT/MGAT family acyltransferase
MEDPTHPMMITVLLVFDAPIEVEKLRAVFSRRLLQFSRFRQLVVQPRDDGGLVLWEDDPSFDSGHHLKQTSLPAPGDEVALRAVVSELISRQLDFSRPLWQSHLIASYGTGCALVRRVHHCLADGPALMHVLRALTDAEPNASLSVTPIQALPTSPEPARGTAAQLTELLVRQGFSILSNPLRFWSLARLGTGTIAAMRKLLWRSPDPRTMFKGRLGVKKQVVWSRPVAMAEVKAVGRAVGGTVNDVMLAAATGALRRYLAGYGESVQQLTIRAGLSSTYAPLTSNPRLATRPVRSSSICPWVLIPFWRGFST